MSLDNRNSKELLTVKQAAEMLGVCPETLRNWDRTNKLKALRHPINGYRLYRWDMLQDLMLVADASEIREEEHAGS